MNCPNCGKDLPDEIQFCPYCMEKFGDVKDYNKSKLVRKKNKFIAVVLAITVVIVVCLLVVVLRNNVPKKEKQYKEDNPKNENIISDNDTNNTDNESTPLNYCGTWYNADFSGESPELDGGSVLKIISMNDEKVIFDLGTYQSPPASRIAEITGVEAEIIDGEAEFIFGNDGWGNGGIGKILFMDEEIYVNIKLTSVSSDSLWNIGTDVKFKKVEDVYINDTIDLLGVLNSDIRVVETKLEKLVDEFDELEEDVYGCEGITVITSNEKVTSVKIEYENLLPGYRKWLCFSFGINGEASFDSVKNRLGTPILTFEKDGNYISLFETSETMESYIEIAYSDGEVVYIRYFIDEIY
ncbi:MAG: zinc ribbon domain-containing protein [Lachnospiraceae bacterium]|nr:zinc ribbon domain-containing protein [Lachnospiraceae bacterium]